jgi:CheY-like chemotaxis protein
MNTPDNNLPRGGLSMTAFTHAAAGMARPLQLNAHADAHIQAQTDAQMDARMDAPALLSQLGAEVANSLSSALERVTTLSTTGRIDRNGLRLLRMEIDRARRAGIMGQQVVRLGSGRVKVARERLNLTALLREALLQRSRDISARGIEVRQELAAATVFSDATLLFSLLETLLDWCFMHTVSRLDFRLHVGGWPVVAQLSGSFLHALPDQTERDVNLDTMGWRLLQQTAAVLKLRLLRRQIDGRTDFSVEFPDTVTTTLADTDSVQLADGSEPSSMSYNSQPLAGRHVMVVAARREVRNLVRETLRSLGLVLDFAASVEEARHLCTGGVPHAVLYEAALAGEGLDTLCNELQADTPTVVFIQIAEQGKAFEVLNVAGKQVASVGREAIAEALPAALMFELARHG